MSRIGKLPITVPDGVELKVSDDNIVTVKGKLGELHEKVHPELTVKVEDGKFRPPEPYKGKGILFKGEQIRRKAGKAAAEK